MKKTNKYIYKIIERLRDGNYHDGNTIGTELAITRTMVWKIMKKMMQYAIPIDSIKGKGYALREPFSLLDESKIKTDIPLHILETIDSTNNYLKKFRNSKTPVICLSEHQSKGKGRLNREWHSPYGQNIYFSCLYPFQKDVSELAGLSLLVSLAVVKTLQKFGVSDLLTVKWSNDVMFDQKKLSGNLIEVFAETHDVCDAIIGIGININMLNDANAITQEWTSLREILGKYVDRNIICTELITTLMDYLARFNQSGFEVFLEEWNKVDGLRHQFIRLLNINQEVTGKVIGVNRYGYLLLELPTGEVKAFSSGQTSIVKRRPAIYSRDPEG